MEQMHLHSSHVWLKPHALGPSMYPARHNSFFIGCQQGNHNVVVKGGGERKRLGMERGEEGSREAQSFDARLAEPSSQLLLP